MHAITTTVDGKPAAVHHNADWDDEVIFTWTEGRDVPCAASVPGELVVAAHERMVARKAESDVEEAEDALAAALERVRQIDVRLAHDVSTVLRLCDDDALRSAASLLCNMATRRAQIVADGDAYGDGGTDDIDALAVCELALLTDQVTRARVRMVKR